MQLTLTWKKGFFSNNCTLYKDGELIGNLREKAFSQTTVSELNGEGYIVQDKRIP